MSPSPRPPERVRARRTRKLIWALLAVGLLSTLACVATLWRATRVPPDPPIAVPQYPEPATNACPELVEAMAGLRPLQDELTAVTKGDDPAHTEAFLRRHAEMLSRCRELLRQDCLAPKLPARDDETLFFGDLLRVAKVVQLQARFHERQGETDLALEAYTDSLRIMPVAERNGPPWGFYGPLRSLMQVAPDLERCVGSGHASPAALGASREALRELYDGRVPLHMVIAEDWRLTRLALDWVRENEQLGDVDLTRLDPFTRAWTLNAGQRELGEAYLVMVEDAKLPYWERSPEKPELKTLVGRVLLPLTPSSRQEVERDALLLGLRAHIDIQLARQETGELPEDLPLPVVDPFDGASMRYVPGKGDYKLYSVGPDGVDDGGTRRLDVDTREGDIIIWPAGEVYGPRTTTQPASQPTP